MRKFFLFLILLILGIVIAASVAWTRRTSIAAHYLTKALYVPTSLGSLEIGKTQANITRLWIGNPPRSRTSTSFSAEKIQIDATLREIIGNPLVIQEINVADIFVGVEYYDSSGKDNNWARILNANPKEPKKNGRGYVIKTLILTNLTVEVTQANGKTKRYPTIPRMEFHNITNETGFPVEEIEKAIFDLVLKDLFRKLNLQQLLETIDPLKNFPGGSPLKRLPGLFD